MGIFTIYKKSVQASVLRILPSADKYVDAKAFDWTVTLPIQLQGKDIWIKHISVVCSSADHGYINSEFTCALFNNDPGMRAVGTGHKTGNGIREGISLGLNGIDQHVQRSVDFYIGKQITSTPRELACSINLVRRFSDLEFDLTNANVGYRLAMSVLQYYYPDIASTFQPLADEFGAPIVAGTPPTIVSFAPNNDPIVFPLVNVRSDNPLVPNQFTIFAEVLEVAIVFEYR